MAKIDKFETFSKSAKKAVPNKEEKQKQKVLRVDENIHLMLKRMVLDEEAETIQQYIQGLIINHAKKKHPEVYEKYK